MSGIEISQETRNIIVNGIIKMADSGKSENTLELAPVRNVSNILNPEEMKITYKDSHRSQHKLQIDNNIPTLYSAAKTPLKLYIKYLNRKKLNYTNLWLRIYPISNDAGFPFQPISSCAKHRRRLCNRYRETNELALESVVEILNYDAKYEYIALESQDCQVSVTCPYNHSDFCYTLEFKCYNSCLKCTRTNFPKLVFCIEEVNLEKNTIKVLAQDELLLKVCASPGRDSKPKRSLRVKEIHQNIPNPPEIPNTNYHFTMFGNVKYVMKLIPEEHVPIVDQLNKVSKHCDSTFNETVETIERKLNERSADIINLLFN